MVGETPEPMSGAIDTPPGFIGMQIGAVPGLLHDIDVPGIEEIGEAPPHLDQAATGDFNVEQGSEDIDNVGDGDSHAVMEPCRQHQGPISDSGIGHGIWDLGFDDLIAVGAPVTMNGVFGDLRSLFENVLDESRPGLAQFGENCIAVRA